MVKAIFVTGTDTQVGKTVITRALVRATRIEEDEGVPDFIREYVTWGAGPRACQYLILGGKARAV